MKINDLNLVEEHLNSNNSPFRFNAKELDSLSRLALRFGKETGNYYYGARYGVYPEHSRRDPKWSILALSQVEGWISVDPLAEKYPSISSYAYVANNPLRYIDPDGREIVEGQEHVDEFKEHTKALIDKKNTTINELREKGKRSRKIKRLENEVSEHEDALNEIQDLENSEQKYSIFTKSKNLRDGTDGRVSYDTENDIVNVEIRGTNKSDLAHELKHAHQFEKQELSFGGHGLTGGDLYDQVNELEAYARGKAYGSSKSFSLDSYSGLTNKPNKRSLHQNSTWFQLVDGNFESQHKSGQPRNIYKGYKADMFVGRYIEAKYRIKIYRY